MKIFLKFIYHFIEIGGKLYINTQFDTFGYTSRIYLDLLN